MKQNGFHKLYIEELKDLYSAETQLTKALPKMAKAASSDELRQAIEQHLKETEGHVQRLEQIFEKLERSPRGKRCKGMAGLIEEGSELLKEKGEMEAEVLDAGLIAAAQRVEHYEIAAYGTARTFAQRLGQQEVAKLLQQTLDEEYAADRKLTAIAEGGVNQEAQAQSSA
ncbi:MAG: ferritin-like domain-containing protein [Chloroflexi bacterium]|nr:MAG: ferritin-like domain-containing protein [Chloroflexota bacterium]